MWPNDGGCKVFQITTCFIVSDPQIDITEVNTRMQKPMKRDPESQQ